MDQATSSSYSPLRAYGRSHAHGQAVDGIADARLRDRAWIAMVGGLDRVLRRCHHVQEYSRAPGCVFRVGLERAQYPALLADGTFVRVGDAVGSLHFWNERLPRFPSSGPDLHWAKIMQRRMRHSLEELCRHVEGDPAWAEVKAIRAEATLPLRPRAGRQLRRLARRFGFEPGAGHALPRGRLSLAAHNALIWGFARAYNPAALPGQRLVQGREELWLSRSSLLARYSSVSAQRDGPPAALHDAA